MPREEKRKLAKAAAIELGMMEYRREIENSEGHANLPKKKKEKAHRKALGKAQALQVQKEKERLRKAGLE